MTQLLNSCTKEQIIGFSILTIISAPYPIKVATVGVPGVTIGEAIVLGYAGGIALVALGIPMIICMIDRNSCKSK